MNTTLLKFIQNNRIDSFQKVSFLLFLHRYADRAGVTREFARQLNFASEPALEEVIDELTAVGLLTEHGGRYMLQNEPEIRQSLDHLVQAYEDPLVRQDLLGQLYRREAMAM